MRNLPTQKRKSSWTQSLNKLKFLEKNRKMGVFWRRYISNSPYFLTAWKQGRLFQTNLTQLRRWFFCPNKTEWHHRDRASPGWVRRYCCRDQGCLWEVKACVNIFKWSDSKNTDDLPFGNHPCFCIIQSLLYGFEQTCIRLALLINIGLIGDFNFGFCHAIIKFGRGPPIACHYPVR